jgi:hypothetical protein
MAVQHNQSDISVHMTRQSNIQRAKTLWSKKRCGENFFTGPGWSKKAKFFHRSGVGQKNELKVFTGTGLVKKM